MLSYYTKARRRSVGDLHFVRALTAANQKNLLMELVSSLNKSLIYTSEVIYTSFHNLLLSNLLKIGRDAFLLAANRYIADKNTLDAQIHKA